MPCTRQELRNGKETLAPFIQPRTQGRKFDETPEWRTHISATDRVIHSRAFRRLEYKTGLLNGTGDHLRTRLTHTIGSLQSPGTSPARSA